jgi:hypothetical protein
MASSSSPVSLSIISRQAARPKRGSTAESIVIPAAVTTIFIIRPLSLVKNIHLPRQDRFKIMHFTGFIIESIRTKSRGKNRRPQKKIAREEINEESCAGDDSRQGLWHWA